MPPEEEQNSDPGVEDSTLELNPPAEGQPEGEEATPDAPQEAAKPDEGGAPSYEPFNLPDGWEIADQDLEAFTAIAADMKLDQEGAQKLVDLFIQVTSERTPQDNGLGDPDQWQAALLENKELGGDNLQKTQANVDLALKLVPDETFEFFKATQFHKHPAILGFLNHLGSLLQETPSGLNDLGAERDDGKTPAQRMFANSGHV